MKKNRIIVFVKNAISGKVKTRLAKTIGDDEALNVYLTLLKETKKAILNLKADKEIWYAWEIGNEDIWNEDQFNKRVQVNGDLGNKMSHAFKTSFEEGLEKVILIGSDCPTLTTGIIEEAYEMLNKNDVVVGPSKDGGYYLIGMSAYKQELFEDISWSTELVMEQTESRASKNGITLGKLQFLNDIDNEDDWNVYLNSTN